jgi:hypothetical protein
MSRSDRPEGAGARLLPDARAAIVVPPALPPALPPLSPPASLPRSAEDLAAERGGYAAWCGPAVVALAAGRPYAEACGLIRRVAPDRYPVGEEIVTAYWRDLIAALALAEVPTEAVPPLAPGAARAPTLVGLARRGGLAPGWYLVRVAGHFLLLRLHGFGLARVFDNRLSGAVLTARTHGRCRVTHLARIAGGPLVGDTA